jgi:hypothetical protein
MADAQTPLRTVGSSDLYVIAEGPFRATIGGQP